jgi:hypothetical protein
VERDAFASVSYLREGSLLGIIAAGSVSRIGGSGEAFCRQTVLLAAEHRGRPSKRICGRTLYGREPRECGPRSGDVRRDRDAPVLGDEVVVHVFDAGGDLGPPEAFGCRTGLAAETASERFVVQQQLQPLGKWLGA